MSSNILKKINIEPNKQSQQIQQYQIDFMSQVEDIEQYEEILEQQKLFEVNQNLFQMHLTIDLPNFSIIQQININLEKVQKTLQKLYIYDIQYLIMDSNQEYFTAVIQNEQISKSLEKTLQTQTQSISVVGVTKQIKVLFLYSLIEEFEEVQEIINDSFNSIKSIEIIGYELKSNISGNYQLDIMNIYNSLYKINRIQESVECQIALGISLYNCRKFNQAQEQFEQASNFYLQMHKQSIKYLTNPQIMNQQNQKNKKNGIIYNLLQYQTTNLSIQKINQHYQNFHSKNQYLYKVAKLYLLVAYSISSFSNFDQKIKAYILAANYYIGDFDPEVDQKQLFKNIQIDPYTGLLKIMPILVSLLLKAIEEESEIIRIAGLVGLEYLIENLGCTISQNFIPILKLIINTYPKLLIVKKNTINNQIQTKLFEIHETQESQYMKTGESQQEDLNLKHSSQNQDENNSFQFQSQNEEQENQYENQNQKETQEQIDKNNIKSGNFQNESQNLEIPNQNTNNQTQNLQIIDHYNRILDSFLNLLASTSSNILREIFNDICIENVYKLDIHPNLQIYLLKFMEKIISICQGDLSINSKFIEQYYNFQLENCQNDSILIEQENQQQLKASQINQKSQNLTQINTVLWDKALKEKLIQNLDTKNINNIIEYVILGIQKILSQTNPPKLLIKITVDIIQSICIKSQKKQMILPKNFANYYTTLQTCQQQININLLVEPLINWINQIIQNPENLEQFKKTWETLTLVLSSQTEKQSSNNQNYFSFSLIAISFINTVYNFIQTNPPTLNMLKYLNIILQSPNQTDEDFQYYMQQFLEKFVQHIPHSIFDETFMVFEQIVSIINDKMTKQLIQLCIDKFFHKYTMKTTIWSQTQQNFLQQIIINNPKQNILNFQIILDYCLLENQIINQNFEKIQEQTKQNQQINSQKSKVQQLKNKLKLKKQQNQSEVQFQIDKKIEKTNQELNYEKLKCFSEFLENIEEPQFLVLFQYIENQFLIQKIKQLFESNSNKIRSKAFQIIKKIFEKYNQLSQTQIKQLENIYIYYKQYQQEVEGIQDLQQIQKILELTEKSNNLQEKEQTLKNQQNNQQQNKQSNLNDNNLYQSQEKKNEKQEHEEKNNSNESSLSQQEDHENKQLKNRFSISKNLIASLILNTLNMYLVNLKDPKQQFNALIQLEQLFSTTLGQSEDNFQNYSNPKTQSSHTNIQESLNFDVSSQNTTFDINLIKNQEQQSTKQTQNKQNTENQDNQSLSGQISDKSLSDKELVTPTNKNKNNNYIKKNNQNQNNNSNNNNQNQSLEYNDSQYLQIRLNCIFEFWPIITQFIHSPWSNIRSLAYSLLCNWIRTDIKNYNSNQQQNLLQKLQEVLQILLSSNESESRTGGLNILGSFCGLSQDFSQIKIYNQFQENQDPNIKQKQLLKQQQQQLLITQKDQLFSYFQRNSTFIDQKIWELVFNIQFDWDITNQAAAMAIIQLCAPREFILELFKQKQDIQQQLQQQQQSNQQQIYQQQQQNSQFFQERQTKNQNQSQNQQQYQSQSNSLLFNNFSKKNNEDFVFSFSSSQSSFCKNWNANFQESQIYKEIQKKKQQDQSFKLSKKLTKENNISQTYSFFQNDNTYMQNDLSLSQDIQALKTNINNHLNLSEITPIKFGDNSDLLTSVKKHLMNQNKDNNNNNNNLIYENNNLIIKPNLFKRDQETQEKNTQDSPKNIDASQLQENFQQQQQQQQQLGQQQFFWVENADEKEIKDMINMFKNEFKPPNSLWIEKINYCEDSFEYLGYEQNSEYQIYEENQNLEEDNDQYQTRLETQLLNNFEFEMYVDPQQLDKQQQIKKRRPQTSYKRKEQLELDETDLQEMKNIKNNQNQGQSPTNDEIKNKNISNNYYDDDENINDEDLMDELDIQEINEEDENLIEQQFENAKNLKNQQIIKQEDEKGKQVQTQFKLNLDKIKDNKQNNNQQPQINNQRIMVQDNQTDSDECNSQNSYNSDQQSSEKDKILNENITEQRQKNSQTPQTQQKIQQNQNNQNQQQLLNINSQIIESQNKIKEKQQQQQQQKKENNQDIDDDNVDNESYNDINEDQQSKNSQGEKEDEEDEDEDEEEIEIKNSYNQQINAELHKNLEDSNFSDEEFIQYDLNRNDFNQKQDQNFNSQELIPDQQDNLQDQNFGKDNKEDSVSHQTKEQQLLYLLQQSLPENLQQSLQNNDLKPGELEKLMIQQSKVSQLSIDLQQFNNQEILNASKKFNSNDNFKSNDSNLELQKQLKLLQQINNLQQSYEDSPLIQTKKQIPKAQNIQTPEINKQKTVQKQNQNQSQNLIQSKNQQQEIKPQETEKITQKLQQQEMPQQNQQQQNKQKSKKNNFSSTPDNSKKHYRNKSSDDKDSKKQQKQKGQNVSSFTKHKKTNTLSYNIDPKLLGNTEPILKQENILSNNQSSDKNQQQQYEITKQKNKSTQKKKSQNLLSSKQYQSLTNTQKLKKKRSQTSQVIDLHQANFKKKNTNNQQINELIQNDNQLKSKNTQESLQIIQNPNLSQDNIQNIKINLEDFLKDKYEQQKKEMQALNKDRLSLLLQKQNTQNNQKSKKLNNQNQSPFQKQNDKKMQQQSNLNHQETPETQKTQKKKKKRSLSMLNTQKFNSQNSQKPQINTLTPQNQKPQKIIQKQVSSAKHSNSHSKQTLLSFSKKHQNHHNHTQNNLNNLNIFKQSNQNNLIDNQTSNKHLLPTKNQQISKEKDKKKKKNSPASKTQPPQKQIFNTNSPIILKNYNLAQNLQNQNQFKKSQSPIKINNYIQQKQNIISNTNINNHSQINTKKQTSSSTQNYNNNNSNNNSNSQSSQGKKTSKNMLINQNYYINNNINNNSHNVNLVNQFKSKQSSSIASNPNYSLNDSKGCDTVSMYSLNSQNHQFK